jgi:iron uptake system component EfeO
MSRIALRPTAATVALAALAGAMTACGSSAEPPKNATKMSFELTDAGCVPHSATVAAGPVVFDIENKGTSKVTEFEVLEGDKIVGEKEDLAEGLDGSFWITLEKGHYTLYCPGGSNERGALTAH